MFTSREGDDHVCGRCIEDPPKFGATGSYGVYDGVLRKAMHQFKYRGNIQLAKPFRLVKSGSEKIHSLGLRTIFPFIYGYGTHEMVGKNG